MTTRRIIITIEGDITDLKAIELVEASIKQGKISNEGKDYSHLCTTKDGYYIASNLKKTKSQTFHIGKENK
jgi:hypothetical protein